jgi:hypothetical protein
MIQCRSKWSDPNGDHFDWRFPHIIATVTDDWDQAVNGALIAASPELFRSARMWIEYLDSPSPDGSGELEEQILGDMRAAIAKAKGAAS